MAGMEKERHLVTHAENKRERRKNEKSAGNVNDVQTDRRRRVGEGGLVRGSSPGARRHHPVRAAGQDEEREGHVREVRTPTGRGTSHKTTSSAACRGLTADSAAVTGKASGQTESASSCR